MFWTLVGLAAAWTVGFELLTCLFRFGLGLRSKVYANRYRRFTLGIRIHHAYFAAAVLPAAYAVPMEGWLRDILAAAAAGLVFSDLLHHFVVLPILTGEFE
jgi:hypothetical protein